MALRRSIAILAAVYAFLWAGGVFSYVALGGPPSGSEWAAPAFLVVAAGLVVLASDRSDRLALAGVALLGWLSELLGVHTGFPFGPYRYTAVLGPSVAGVPLVMTAAWVVVFAFAWQAAGGWRLPAWVRAAAGAAAVTSVDFVIDPLAAGPLGYWTWSAGGPYYGIPWSNFAGWFGVSLMLFAVVRRPPVPSATVRWTGRSVIAFFAVIAAARGLWPVAALGALLAAADILQAGRPAGSSPRPD